MINNDMRTYTYFTFGDKDAYGQPVLSQEPKGTIKMAINISNQSIQDNINYKGATYIGLTQAAVNDTFVIEYEDKRLKVLYVKSKRKI